MADYCVQSLHGALEVEGKKGVFATIFKPPDMSCCNSNSPRWSGEWPTPSSNVIVIRGGAN